MATQKIIKEKDNTFIQDPCSVCLGMKERGGLYSSSGENMNVRPFNEG